MIETSTAEMTESGFSVKFKSNYAEVGVNQEKKAICCVLIQDYVPIEDFRSTFHQISEIASEGVYEKFIFDKRALRTFHQPSMEWYFIEWKTKMVGFGIRKHRKILPDLEWFAKAVEIAKRPLLEKISKELRDQLDIVYCNSIEECINT